MSDENTNQGRENLNDESPSHSNLSDEEQTRKDMAYSPASETETETKQDNSNESIALDDDDIDQDAVKTLPGTGGPDDVGEIDMDRSQFDI